MTTGYVYKLCCSDVTVTEIYVGSTKSLRNRRAGHKTACNNPANHNYNMQVYQYIREHGGFKNWSMIVIETFNYNEKYELKARERHWIETLQSSLNVQVPTRTDAEYYDDNKEELLSKMHDYYEANAGRIKARVKEYSQAHTEEIKHYRTQYNEDNAEIISQKCQERYQVNKRAILAKHAQRITCECGIEIAFGKQARHRKTAKHIALIAAQSIATPNIASPTTPANDLAQLGATNV